MITKPEIKTLVSEFFNEHGEYPVVFSGAALVMYGLRSLTTDIDCFVSSKLFDELKKTWPTNEKGYVQYKDVFEVSTWNHEGNVFIIDTVVCLSLDEIVKQKKEWGREKDLRDLELIELSKLNS